MGGGPPALYALFSGGALGSLSDRELLEVYRDGEKPRAELAFRLLVERHGPMVFALCRSLLRDPNDAEDAFQATFVVLARKADSIRNRDTIGPWLHGVAGRVARRARTLSLRRRVREREAAEIHVLQGQDTSGVLEIARTLHEEIDRLPERFRAALILCCLQDQSYEAAARSLDITEPTLRGRLYRARKILRSRLERRGVETSVLPAAMRLGTGSSDALPSRLVEVSVQQAIRWASDGRLSTAVASLVQGGIHSMTMSMYKAVAVSLLSVVLAVGTIVVAQTKGKAPSEGASAPPSGGARLAKNKEAKAPQAKDPKEATRAILDMLAKPSQLTFPSEMSLEVLLKTVKVQTTSPGNNGLPIYVNPDGLQESKQTMMSLIRLDHKEKSLGEDLARALRSLQLGFFVEDGLFCIDSRTGVLENRLLILEGKIDRLLRANDASPRPE